MIKSALITLALAALIAPARAETDQDGHAMFHHFYMRQMQPGTGMSCCGNNDCHPISAYRTTADGIEMNVAGRWMAAPMSKVIETETPDQKGHWCGVNERSTLPITYCVIIPKGNT